MAAWLSRRQVKHEAQAIQAQAILFCLWLGRHCEVAAVHNGSSVKRSTSPPHPAPNQSLLQARTVLGACDMTIALLAMAALTADPARETGMPDSLAAQLNQEARSLMQRRLELLDGLAADARAANRTPHLRQLLQPAAELAALMQQCLALPAVEEERRLAVARAAAARSCAYLRCADVAGEGGPAAGQGIGSMRCRWAGERIAIKAFCIRVRLSHPAACALPSTLCLHHTPPPCSACRAVWYCGTACSHADWRAGHRRVCKALGAERLARKQAAAAGAATEQQ